MTAAADVGKSSAHARMVEALVAVGREDRAAFEELYRLTSAKLYGVCLRICGEKQGAEDVLQEVYLTVWRRADGYEPGRASPLTWLGTIARNRAIDWRRAHPTSAENAIQDAAALPDPAPDAVRGLLNAEEDRRLHLCLDELDQEQRDAILTAFYDGVTYADLAIRRDIPAGTVKSWIRRGLLRLRQCLRDDG